MSAVSLSPLTNLRDLAGIPVADGVVRPGVLMRADDVSRVDPSGARQLLEQGLTLVLDLRSVEELAHTGRGPLADTPVEHRHLPMSSHDATPGADLAATLREYFGDDPSTGMGTWYAMTAVAQVDKILTGFEAIVTTPGAALFHCTAGKDRTGIFAAAALLALGASEDDVVADYVRTNDNLDALLARIADGGGSARAITSDSIPMAVRGAPELNMRTMLERLRTDNGGLVQVLVDHGLDDRLRTALRDKVVLPV